MAPPTSSPTTYAPNGLVCSVDHLASTAGVAMLRAGGTAADGAIAANAVLAVVAPHLCGMGGDLFAIVHQGGPPEVLNASGRAGSGADPDRLRAEGHSVMPFRDDVRSAPVPGCVDGWLALHERHGRLALPEVLAPAVGYARDGFPASPLLAAMSPLLGDMVGGDDLKGVRPGAKVVRADLARMIEIVAAEGRQGFYEGEFGRALLAVGDGEFGPADLEARLADWVEPLGVSVWGHEVWTVPPNSQGYLTLAAAVIAEDFDLADPDEPAWAHGLVEAARYAGFDRGEVLHEDADGVSLVAPERLDARRAAIDPDRAGDVGGSFAAGGTMYLCAVDAERMAVSLIQSNASGFGAHVEVPGTGILLHNRGLGFSLEPGHPAEYGPGRRPPHTLAPAMVTTPDGDLRAVLGTMGGDSQPQILLQLLVRLLVIGQRAGDALSAPRWVLENPGGSGFDVWNTDRPAVRVESDGHRVWADGLATRGHQVVEGDPQSGQFGHAQVIEPTGGALAGAADPRAGVGAAVGY